MSDHLLNFIILGFYVVTLLAIGFSRSRRAKVDREDYFLGGRRFGWLLIGVSIFATNVSSINIVGYAGFAYRIGVAASTPQLIGGLMMLITAVYFVPVYVRSGFYTIPDFLERRFDRRCMLVFCGVLISTALVSIPTIVYAGCLVVLRLFDLDFSHLALCAAILGSVVGLYTISGGLTSVVHTDVLQAVFIIGGGVLVLICGLHAAGGLSSVMAAMPESHLSMIHPEHRRQMPFSGVATGLMLSSFIWASSNQNLLQRTLGARDCRQAQMGMVLAAFLKLAGVFLLAFPGLIALKLFPDVPPDLAFPTLVKAVLPAGLSGIVLVGFLAAMMSSLDSTLLSMSSIFSLKIYPLFRPNEDENRSLRVGRIVGFGLLVWGVVAAPFIQYLGLIYLIGLKVNSFMMCSIGICYLFGRFSNRVNAHGAFVTLIAGLIAGPLLVAATSWPALYNQLPATFRELHFFHLTALLSLVFVALLTVASRWGSGSSESQLQLVNHQKEYSGKTDLRSSSAGPAPVPMGWCIGLYVIALIAIFVGF